MTALLFHFYVFYYFRPLIQQFLSDFSHTFQTMKMAFFDHSVLHMYIWSQAFMHVTIIHQIWTVCKENAMAYK